MAGLTVATVLVPQSLAYAELAGMPAYHGLYAAAVPPIAAAAFASSRHLQTGPTAITSLLTLGTLVVLFTPRGPPYVGAAALLALVVGAVRLVLGSGRLGVIAYLMSQPVMTGFTVAAGVLIVLSQLPSALGAQPPTGDLLAQGWWALSHPREWDGFAALLALGAVVLLWGGRRLHALFPGALLAVVAGIGVSLALGYSGATVGPVPSSLPRLSVDLPWQALPSLLVPGLVIAVVGFAEPAAIARTFAAQDREAWSANRELVSQGVANLASGLSGGFPVGASFSRSPLGRLTGAQTRWTGAVAGSAVLTIIPIAWILSPLPSAVLAGIVIGAVAGLIRPGAILDLWSKSPPQGLVAVTTFLATLALAPRIDRAVLLGVAMAVTVHLWRELALDIQSSIEDGDLYLVPTGVLWFGSAPRLEEALLDMLARYPQVHRLTLDLTRLGRVDITGAQAMESVIREAEEAGLEVRLQGVPPHARRLLGDLAEAVNEEAG